MWSSLAPWLLLSHVVGLPVQAKPRLVVVERASNFERRFTELRITNRTGDTIRCHATGATLELERGWFVRDEWHPAPDPRCAFGRRLYDLAPGESLGAVVARNLDVVDVLYRATVEVRGTPMRPVSKEVVCLAPLGGSEARSQIFRYCGESWLASDATCFAGPDVEIDVYRDGGGWTVLVGEHLPWSSDSGICLELSSDWRELERATWGWLHGRGAHSSTATRSEFLLDEAGLTEGAVRFEFRLRFPDSLPFVHTGRWMHGALEFARPD